MSVELIRTYRFSAAHRYYRPEWSAEENTLRFGKCALAPGHGHNYRLTLRLRGIPDPETGFVIDLGLLDRIVGSRVLEPLDHHHINEAIAEFGSGRQIPSSENLAIWVAARLSSHMPEGVALAGMDLWEDDDLGAAWRPDPAELP